MPTLTSFRSRAARSGIAGFRPPLSDSFGRWLIVSVALLGFAAVSLSRPGNVSAEDSRSKNVLMIAGKPSHGFGSHEHYAGLRVLAETLSAPELKLNVRVVRDWPEDSELIASADSIVVFSDGGGRHPALPHLETLTKRLDEGCGFVCIHYAVEVPKGEPGQAWLRYLGGYFETDWSVNPHWMAEFKQFPDHPIARGVEPFAVQDEWYFHMRFPDPPTGVTPILQAVAPESTMRRPDGPHSGNPAVRKSVAQGDPQTVAWAFDRPDGGRSFGFTGGHFHWNWGIPAFRKLVGNAILWSAGGEIPTSGVGAKPLGVDRLLQDQDFPKPDGFDAEATARQYQLGAATPRAGDRRQGQPLVTQLAKPTAVESQAKPKRLWGSPLITTATPGHAVDARVDIRGTRDLFLVVTDGGNGYACDWADWIDPVLVGDDGELSLVEVPWKRAEAGFGKVHRNANAGGEPLSVENRPVELPGIGTHANSLIHYELPAGYHTLRVTGALDSGGTNQNGGGSSSVRFVVFADAAPVVAEQESVVAADERLPEAAVAALDSPPDLEVTLSASEPVVRNLTNLDIDDRGRVWVCEVMNYRRHAGTRPEGDRILIMEDTDGDGVMDSVKTFYQGTDIDSAMGLCVLGNEVIVSAAPYILRLIDDNGDDVADRKEVMFSQTGQPQHDHSNHSFVFGPDGKLYWNFGNTGLHVKDATGETVVDIHGRPIVDNGKPFWGGMVFRCELDGSRMEVLGHNFRNNWETAVDSYGALWQSDNDDDGNRGTRINFVMEHGNYGYRDELTGAGWQAERIGWESEVPLRHWHLHDPGVVPNLLQTGAGSPTGIMVYEGDLLPDRFRGEVIHCDPGPNVVRAYPVTPKGAGYQATIEPLITGARDPWFRPVDVCAAPDGSLFVTDWYDPGVGGHRQEDTERGRLFRIAPPGMKYVVPKFDYSTPAGAVAALRSPTMAVRYKAWMALHAMGADAEPWLLEMYTDADPRMRARALWLLGKIAGRGEPYVRLALDDQDENIRMTAIRLLRQLELVPTKLLSRIDEDPSPAVRREALVALRYDRDPGMPELWARLAALHDGQDRWYLEALGIASDVRAEECFRALDRSVDGKWDTPELADIVWRLRTPEAAEHLVALIADSETDLAATDRYFRSLDFHTPEDRAKPLRATFLTEEFAGSATTAAAGARNDAIIVRSLERVPDKLTDYPDAVQRAVTRHIQSLRGTPAFLKLVARLRPVGVAEGLIELAIGQDDSAGVEAVRWLLVEGDGRSRLVATATGEDETPAVRLATRLGLLGNPAAIALLADWATQETLPYAVRSAAVRGLAASRLGVERLLQAAQAGKLVPDTRLLAGGLLARSDQEKVRELAGQVLPLPVQADARPLPTVDELTGMKGDPQQGESLFRTKATCANCHVVNGFGKQVGPDLSEIGSKLSAEAMYTSILDPSAGISHNYETYLALLDSGQVISGMLINQTDDAVTIRTAEAIDRTIPREEMLELKKSDKSIMPEGLHQTVDPQGLVDIVHYMLLLKRQD